MSFFLSREFGGAMEQGNNGGQEWWRTRSRSTGFWQVGIQKVRVGYVKHEMLETRQ